MTIARRVAARWLGARANPAWGRDHFLIEEPGNFLSVMAIEDEVPCLKGVIGLAPAPGCGPAVMSVEYVEAAQGYGPWLYDAAMEYVYPKGLTPAQKTGTSPKALAVWDFYLNRRSDVDKHPKPDTARCMLKGHEALDHIYYKKPAAAARALMTVEQFNNHPVVVREFGESPNVRLPRDEVPECAMMGRQGGLFEPPPAMYRAIRDWMISVYAGHVWAKAEAKLPHFIGKRDLAKAALAKVRDYGQKLPRLIAQGKKFRLSLTEPVVWAVSAEPQDSYRRADGTYTNNWYVVVTPLGGRSKIKRYIAEETMVDAIEKMLGRLRERLQIDMENPGVLEGLPPDTKIPTLVRTKSRFVELVRLIKLAKTLTSKPKLYKARAKRVFDVDLRGWSLDPGGDTDDALGTTSITCVLNFTQHVRREGQWDRWESVLEVDVQKGTPQGPKAFQQQIDHIEETLVHELTHVSQSLVAVLHGTKGGLPGKGVRDPGYSPEGWARGKSKQREHPLRDVEFYPRLGDEVRGIKRVINKVPPKYRAEAMRRWVAESISQEAAKVLNELRIQPTELFLQLKEHSPDKWRKAVKEFYKAVGTV